VRSGCAEVSTRARPSPRRLASSGMGKMPPCAVQSAQSAWAQTHVDEAGGGSPRDPRHPDTGSPTMGPAPPAGEHEISDVLRHNLVLLPPVAAATAQPLCPAPSHPHDVRVHALTKELWVPPIRKECPEIGLLPSPTHTPLIRSRNTFLVNGRTLPPRPVYAKRGEDAGAATPRM
jgi:hypothetical protein